MSCDDHVRYRQGVAPTDAATWEQPSLPLGIPDPLPTSDDVMGAMADNVPFATYLTTMDVLAVTTRLDGDVTALRQELDETAEQMRALTFAVLGTGIAGLLLALVVVWTRVL
jgi:hypothetical protein